MSTITLPVGQPVHLPARRSLFALIALMGMMATLLSGCINTSTLPYLPDDQQVLRVPINANSRDIPTMDPARVQDYYSYMPVELVFPGLLTLDAGGNPTPWAATALPTYDPASNSYTFKVRSGLKWSDGTPIDASTFAYSINRSLSPCTGSAVTYYLFPIKDAASFSNQRCAPDGKTIQGKIQSLIGDSLLVPDPQTLVIRLTAPAPYLLAALNYPTAYAQPRQLIDQYGKIEWTNHLTDNGGFGGNLYQVKTWDHAGNLDLVRNMSFWGTMPRLREVDFKVYRTVDEEYSDYQIGKLDIGMPTLADYAEAKHRAGFHELPYLGIAYFQPTWQQAPFNDLRVRQAFALAINKETLATSVLHGSVIPTNHIVPQGTYGYDPALVGPDGTANLTGNLPLAQQLMQQYADDRCGGKLSKCPPIFIPDGCYNSTASALVAYEQAAVQAWQQAFPGYSIRLKPIDFGCPELSFIYGVPAPQLVGMAWIADYPDPQDWLSLQFGATALNNFGNVNVPAANTLMTVADTSLDSSTRGVLYTQAEQMLVSQVAWIPLYQQKFYYNLPTYVHGVVFTSLGQIPLASWQQILLHSH